MEEHEFSFVPIPCPVCEEPAPLVKEGFRTLVGYVNPGGVPHDGNCFEGIFECKDGHQFFATTHKQCTCGWTAARKCTITGHDQRTVIKNKIDIENTGWREILGIKNA